MLHSLSPGTLWTWPLFRLFLWPILLLSRAVSNSSIWF
jgi:hypothetical protein